MTTRDEWSVETGNKYTHIDDDEKENEKVIFYVLLWGR
jgi:hypothetical protein